MVLVGTASASAEKAVNVEKSLLKDAISLTAYRILNGSREDQEIFKNKDLKIENVSLAGLEEPVTIYLKIKSTRGLKKKEKELPVEAKTLNIRISGINSELNCSLDKKTAVIKISGNIPPDSVTTAKGFAEDVLNSINSAMKKNTYEIVDDTATDTWNSIQKGASFTWEEVIVPAANWTGGAMKTSYNWTKKQIHNITGPSGHKK